MPEAPEVERMRQRLLSLRGLQVDAVRVVDPKLALRAASLLGRELLDVNRHGKRLNLEFAEEVTLRCQPGLTGDLREVAARELAMTTSLGAVIAFGSRHVVYVDRRRLGNLWIADRNSPVDDGLGVDLLDASERDFRDAAGSCVRRRRRVKALMLDQQGPIAGAGNYLIDEACFSTRVHPATSADRLSERTWQELWGACRELARRSAAGRPPTLEAYLAPAGAHGACPGQLRCYGRGGWPCTECRTPLARTRIAGRGTTYCPRCQPAPPVLVAGGAPPVSVGDRVALSRARNEPARLSR